jgi:hypothetical protein
MKKIRIPGHQEIRVQRIGISGYKFKTIPN